MQRVSTAQAGALQARIEARNMMRYSETWREHRMGVISRNLAADAMVLVNMKSEDIESWLSDAQADFDSAVSRFAEQCQALSDMHRRMQTKQRDLAADSAVQNALFAASDGSKSAYRFGTSPTATTSVKKLEHELALLKQFQTR